MHRQTGGVAEQPMDSDAIGIERRRSETPASRVAGDRLVQADPARLDQPEDAPGGHRLRERGGLEAAGGRYRLAGHAVATP
jgi:hypothetical protein